MILPARLSLYASLLRAPPILLLLLLLRALAIYGLRSQDAICHPYMALRLILLHERGGDSRHGRAEKCCFLRLWPAEGALQEEAAHRFSARQRDIQARRLTACLLTLDDDIASSTRGHAQLCSGPRVGERRTFSKAMPNRRAVFS